MARPGLGEGLISSFGVSFPPGLGRLSPLRLPGPEWNRDFASAVLAQAGVVDELDLIFPEDRHR